MQHIGTCVLARESEPVSWLENEGPCALPHRGPGGHSGPDEHVDVRAPVPRHRPEPARSGDPTVDKDLRYLVAEGEALANAGWDRSLEGNTLSEVLEPQRVNGARTGVPRCVGGRAAELEITSANGRHNIVRMGPTRRLPQTSLCVPSLRVHGRVHPRDRAILTPSMPHPRGTPREETPARHRFLGWAMADSNRRPLPCEGSALTN
jgi:hypothetical protein